MKTKNLIALFLLAVISASTLASCKQTTTTPDNPFAVETSLGDKGTTSRESSNDAPSTNDAPSNQDPLNENPTNDWTPSASVGEKRLYEKNDYGIYRYGDMMIGTTNYCNLLGYFSIDEPRNAKLICFDPLCMHLPWQESCAAVFNYYTDQDGHTLDYPRGMYIDLYESTESPVLYFFYLRNDSYMINREENGYRDPVYCIERYDLSKGYREVVLDNVENTIQQACNYGDYVYYVLDMGENEGQMLYRVHKSGGKSQQLDRDENAISIKISDAIDDKLFYTINDRYIYSTNLDLTDSKKVFDMAEFKGKDGSLGVLAGLYSGYLYYFADVETVYANDKENSPSDQKCNLYRIPMTDLAKTPEMVVEGMLYASDCYRFSEKTLYYEPCVFKSVDVKGKPGLTSVNFSDGKLMALDLETGESKTIVEDSGLTIYPNIAWDDMVIFTAWAYEESGKATAGDNVNNIIAYASGEPYKVWCRGGPCVITDEYWAELQ